VFQKKGTLKKSTAKKGREREKDTKLDICFFGFGNKLMKN